MCARIAIDQKAYAQRGRGLMAPLTVVAVLVSLLVCLLSYYVFGRKSNVDVADLAGRGAAAALPLGGAVDELLGQADPAAAAASGSRVRPKDARPPEPADDNAAPPPKSDQPPLQGGAGAADDDCQGSGHRFS